MEEETEVQETTEEVTPEVTEETPAEETAEVQPEAAETQTETYELPDGRKLTGDEVKEEYLKLNSEFTRKSQELAGLKKPQATEEPNKPDAQHPWEDPNYQPQTMKDVVDVVKQNLKWESEQQKTAEQSARQDLETQTNSQLEEIRKMEPDLNENFLFAHATKYGFSDLKGAFTNMKDMNLAVKRTEQKAVENMRNRETTAPINDGTQSSGEGMTHQEYLMSLDETPQEALRRLK